MRGAHIANVLSLMPDETILRCWFVDFEQANMTLIAQARIKRMAPPSRQRRATGLIAMNLTKTTRWIGR